MKPRDRREQTKKSQPRAKAQERLKAAAGGGEAKEAPAAPAAPAAAPAEGEAKEAAAS
jgi:small subunit ribosomal protein S16